MDKNRREKKKEEIEKQGNKGRYGKAKSTSDAVEIISTHQCTYRCYAKAKN